MPARRLAALVGIGLAAAGLTACDTPSPRASFFSGSETVSTEAVAWCTGNGTVASDPLAADCVRGPEIAATVEAVPGTQVGVEVDPAVAEDGWAVTLLRSDGQVGRVPVSRGNSYARFTVPVADAAGAQTYVVEIVALRPGKQADTARGLWRFRLDTVDSR